MSHFLYYLVEPLSYVIYFIGFLFLFFKVEKQAIYLSLAIFFLASSALMMRAAIRLGPEDYNTYLYNILYLITSLAFSFYFFKLLNKQWKQAVAILTGIFVLIYYLINIKEVYFDSIGFVINSTGIILLIFLYLHQIMTNVTEELLSNNFDFWFICVQLMYHLGSFAIFLSYNYFTHRFFSAGSDSAEISTILGYLWVVHNVLLFLGAIITCSGIAWIYHKKLRLL